MHSRFTLVAPWLVAAAIGGAVAFAPLASANTDPGVPYGGNRDWNGSTIHPDPSTFGFHPDNHDEVDNTAGSVDVPF